MEMTQEALAKARAAKTPDELMTLAKENGEELTEEAAKAYFAQLNPKTGELNDEELDNVSGGGCHTKDGRLVVTAVTTCSGFCCKKDDGWRHGNIAGLPYCRTCGATANCSQCKYCTYEKGLWLCNNPERMR